MNFFKRIAEKIKSLWTKKNEVALKVVPTAIRVVEAWKKVMDGPMDEAIVAMLRYTTAAPVGEIAEKIRLGMIAVIPKSLLTLNMINAIAGIEDPEEQMLAIMAQFKFSPEDQKKQAYHLFAVHMIQYLSDGKLTWGECVKLAEEGYEIYVLERDGAIAA